jgi:CO dehydrogenase/acetyl-CoA synthase gamma subunit (corrinoid Fe-S protein)
LHRLARFFSHHITFSVSPIIIPQWRATGGEEFNTHSVVSAIKTSGINELVDHRKLILPSLGAPGIKAKDVENQTGWTVQWGRCE